MKENNDTNAEALTANEEPGSAPASGSGLRDDGPTPIFVSFVYDFIKTDPDLGGDGGGRPGTLGSAISGQEPKYKVYTYQYLPSVGENIGENIGNS